MRWCLLCVVVLVVLSAAIAGWALAADQANPNPGVIPLNAKVGGLTYADWGDANWRWVLSVPAADCPVLSGAGPAQFSGPVFMLSNVPSVPGEINIAECSVTVGHDQALFLPLATTAFWVADACLTDGTCADGTSLEELPQLWRSCAATCMEQVTDLYAIVDGKPLRDLSQYRVQSSQPFASPYPEGSWFSGSEGEGGVIGDEPGVLLGCVADGYYLLLAPLSKGEHTLSYGASCPQFGEGTVAGVIYHITVE